VSARSASAHAAYAASASASRGRRFAEPASPTRNDFQRDRDRIVHSSAFRRLEYKTQVFLNHEGDWFRTRLTHSIEVAQIARSICRPLGLDEDLTEAIALAHDLGHTPFGHSGQDALNECMRSHGGFEHNLQSLRVVDLLEQRYAEFDGLNLCFETREGILKHCSVVSARTLGDVGERFLAKTQPSLEAQIANLADEIAYTNHDLDDGLRSGLITLDQLRTLPLFGRLSSEVLARYPDIAYRRLIHETIRRIITVLIEDVLAETNRRISTHSPTSIDAVRAAPSLAGFSPAVGAELATVKHFLMSQLYRHPQVMARMTEAKTLVVRLFDAYCARPNEMPAEHALRWQEIGPRAVADYLAGMTDRFATLRAQELAGQDLGA
jgi:dGTPase